MNARDMFLSPRGFLLVGGAVLAVVGVVGFLGVIGPTPERSIFGSAWWFDSGENWAHLLLGVVGLVAAYALPAVYQRYLVLALGVVGIPIGVYSIFMSGFLGSNLENPADTLLHLAVGGWAIAAATMKPTAMTAPHRARPA